MVKAFKERRKAEATYLKRKIEAVERYKKKLEVVSDTSKEVLLEQRLTEVFDLAEKEGVLFNEKMDTLYFDRNTPIPATYKKGDVELKLKGYLSTTSDGVVTLEFSKKTDRDYYYSRGPRVIRVTVGKINRVTNNVLNALMTKEAEDPYR